MSATVALRRHRACCQCGRLKHPDGTPHGRRAEPDQLLAVVRHQANSGVSHGYCLECKRQLLANVRPVA